MLEGKEVMLLLKLPQEEVIKLPLLVKTIPRTQKNWKCFSAEVNFLVQSLALPVAMELNYHLENFNILLFVNEGYIYIYRSSAVSSELILGAVLLSIFGGGGVTHLKVNN